MHRTILMSLLGCLALLPGCIVQDIRDEMRSANGQLLCVQEGLDKANAGLKDANAALAQTNERLDKVDQGLTRLDRTNSLIDNVEQGLGRIDRTNASLTDLEKQLLLLRSIETSLARLDQHLTAVRKTMASLDGLVPFLDLDTGPMTEAPAVGALVNAPSSGPNASHGTVEAGVANADAVPAPAAGVNATAAPSSADASDPAAAARAARDPLLGIWISQFPEKDHVLILQTGGQYIRSSVDKAGVFSVTRGTFTKERGGALALRFTPDVPPAPTPDPSGKHAPSPVAPAAAEGAVLQIVSQGQRSLALQRDGVVYVYARP